MPSCAATRRASSTSLTLQQPLSLSPPHSLSVTPGDVVAFVAQERRRDRRVDTAAHHHHDAAHARAQLLDDFGNHGKRLVDVVGGRRVAEREPHRGERALASACPSRAARATGRSHLSCTPSPTPRTRPAGRARRAASPLRDRRSRRATGRPLDALASPFDAKPGTSSRKPRSSRSRNVPIRATSCGALVVGRFATRSRARRCPRRSACPARSPYSWPPPSTSGMSATPSRTTSAPTPFGPPNLWPEIATSCAGAAAVRRSSHCGACTASVWNTARGARSRTRAATSSSGCTTPVSLLTSITETTAVRSSSASASRSRSTTPPGVAPTSRVREAVAFEARGGAQHGLVLDARDDHAVAIGVLGTRGPRPRP